MAVAFFQRKDSEVWSPDDSNQRVTAHTFLFNLAKRHLYTTPLFRHVKTDEKLEEELQDLEGWRMPQYFLQNFPYYCSGCSYSGGPLWVVEAGKFDVRALVNQPAEIVDCVDKCLVQVFTFLVKSMVDERRDGRVCRIQAILDFEGMSFWKVGSPSAIALILKICARYKDVVDELLHEAYLINVNSVVEMLLKRASPFLGQLMKKVKVYGRNERNWLDKIQNKFPSSSIPEAYGGSYRYVPTYS